MDIIVTLPQNEDWEEWFQECEDVAKNPSMELRFYLGERGLPRNTNPGERCYVVYQGEIRGYHIITELAWRESFICQTTGRKWEEGNYIIRTGKFIEIEPIPMVGFQGFRYAKLEKEIN